MTTMRPDRTETLTGLKVHGLNPNIRVDKAAFLVWLKDRDPNGRILSGIPSARQYKYGVGVLWVAVHPSFRQDSREHNIALVVTMWPLQFNAFTYPICLPSPEDSDTNAGDVVLYYNCYLVATCTAYPSSDPLGITKYSVKALRKRNQPLKKYSGVNGMSIYGECIEKTCIKYVSQTQGPSLLRSVAYF